MMLTSCTEDDDNGPAHPGLGIKTFFPTKVVTNQPMTINGSGFTDVTEIEFPGGAKVTNFEIVSDDMIRVDAPSGIATEGGKIVLRSANGQVESRQPLTVGHTQVTGFSKQPGETAAGGELITVFGTDLEFINAVELLDADSVPQLIDHQDFYRKGTSNLVFRVPLKNIYKGTFEGILHTYDGQRISMPELTYEPAADEGHWETVKTVIWQNNGAGAVSWNGTYRFALEGHDGANECIAEIPQDIWDRMMTETFYLDIEATDPQVRITNGWWDSNWKDDIQPGNELLTDNGDGTWTVAISVADNPAYVATLLEKHILFTGDRYTPIQIYFEDQKWVDGGGHTEIVKTSIWKGDGSAGAVSWSSQYRFSSANNVTGEEIYAIPMDIWEKMKTSTFYLDLEATDPQIRVTTGWWTTTWTGDDIFPGNEHLTDNGDGTFTLEVNLSGDAALLDLLDVQHLLFTGDRYTPRKLYYYE